MWQLASIDYDGELRIIVADTNGDRRLLRFEDPIAWQVLDETLPSDERYLEHLQARPGWETAVVAAATHFRIVTLDDLIDVIAVDPPIVSEAGGRRPERYVQGYTIALWIVGLFLGLAAAMLHFVVIGQAKGETWALELARNGELILAAACLLVAALRSAGTRAARTSTAALSIILALWIPFGTALFVWWLVSVRKQEQG